MASAINMLFPFLGPYATGVGQPKSTPAAQRPPQVAPAYSGVEGGKRGFERFLEAPPPRKRPAKEEEPIEPLKYPKPRAGEHERVGEEVGDSGEDTFAGLHGRWKPPASAGQQAHEAVMRQLFQNPEVGVDHQLRFWTEYAQRRGKDNPVQWANRFLTMARYAIDTRDTPGTFELWYEKLRESLDVEQAQTELDRLTGLPIVQTHPDGGVTVGTGTRRERVFADADMLDNIETLVRAVGRQVKPRYDIEHHIGKQLKSGSISETLDLMGVMSAMDTGPSPGFIQNAEVAGNTLEQILADPEMAAKLEKPMPRDSATWLLSRLGQFGSGKLADQLRAAASGDQTVSIREVIDTWQQLSDSEHSSVVRQHLGRGANLHQNIGEYINGAPDFVKPNQDMFPEEHMPGDTLVVTHRVTKDGTPGPDRYYYLHGGNVDVVTRMKESDVGEVEDITGPEQMRSYLTQEKRQLQPSKMEYGEFRQLLLSDSNLRVHMVRPEYDNGVKSSPGGSDILWPLQGATKELIRFARGQGPALPITEAEPDYITTSHRDQEMGRAADVPKGTFTAPKPSPYPFPTTLIPTALRPPMEPRREPDVSKKAQVVRQVLGALDDRDLAGVFGRNQKSIAIENWIKSSVPKKTMLVNGKKVSVTIDDATARSVAKYIERFKSSEYFEMTDLSKLSDVLPPERMEEEIGATISQKQLNAVRRDYLIEWAEDHLRQAESQQSPISTEYNRIRAMP